jgi:predicted Zn-dependent protease
MDKIYIFNASRKIADSIIEKSISEIGRLNPLEGILVENSENMISECIRDSFNEQRNQVNYSSFLFSFLDSLKQKGLDNQTKKIAFFDEDLYMGNVGWVFGGYQPIPLSPGLIILSGHRLIDPLQMKDIICHELGHMFNAPSNGRKNTYELLGLHCSNYLCVMKQNMSIQKAVRYAHKRLARNADTFCDECQNDIKSYFYKLSE